MGDGLARIVLVGEAAGEDHVRRDPVALGEAIDILVRFGGMHVVDAQVERRQISKSGSTQTVEIPQVVSIRVVIAPPWTTPLSGLPMIAWL